MNSWFLLAALFLATCWWELSGNGPRFRARLERRVFDWVVDWGRKKS